MARRPRGQLEADVLDVLWEGGWRTPGQVCAAIAQPPSPAYSTVLTTLRRLWKKGLVERRRDGRGHAYHAVRGREEHAAATMQEMLASAHDPSSALGHFVDRLPPDQVGHLRALLRSRPRR